MSSPRWWGSLPGGALFSCLIVAVAGSPRGYRQCFLPRSRGHRVFQEARCRCLFFRLLQPSHCLGETGRNLLAVLVFFFLFGSLSLPVVVLLFRPRRRLCRFRCPRRLRPHSSSKSSSSSCSSSSSVWSSSSASPSPYLSRSTVCKHSD